MNFGNPEKPESFWFLEETIKGIGKACQVLDLPAVNSHASLYNEFTTDQGSREILLTSVIGIVGLMNDYNKVVVCLGNMQKTKSG